MAGNVDRANYSTSGTVWTYTLLSEVHSGRGCTEASEPKPIYPLVTYGTGLPVIESCHTESTGV